MTASKVVEKIIQDADHEVRVIHERYKAEGDKIKKEYQEKIDRRRAQNKAEAESMEKTLTMRTVSRQRLALSQDIIGRKHKMIGKVIKEAVKQLVSNDGYVEFLQSLIAKSHETDGEIMLSEKDIKNHRRKLEAFLKKNKLQHKLNAAEEISGGVIIKKDQKTYLGSLDIISDLLSDEISIEAARILFEGGSK